MPTPSPTPTPATIPTPTPTTSPPASCTVDAANNLVTYGSGGTQVTGAFYRPQGSGPFPAVLVLHTRGGLSSHERSISSLLAAQGYVALAPDYMAAVGVTPRTFEVQTFWALYTDQVQEHLARGLSCLESLPYVDKQRIGAVGFSLGGYFTLVMGTRGNVKAVVSYYGAYHGRPVSSVPTQHPLSDYAVQMRAQVLMLHGDADSTAPISRARAVQNLLLTAGKQSELVVYPGVEHEFNKVGDPFYNAAATADAGARTLAFLAAWLK